MKETIDIIQTVVGVIVTGTVFYYGNKFSRELELMKSNLGRDNISFQIHTAEYIRMRFQRLDELYVRMYELMDYCQREFNATSPPEPMEMKLNAFWDLKSKVDDGLYRASIYIEDDVWVPVIDFIKVCERVESAWRRMKASHDQMVKANEAGQTDRYAGFSGTYMTALTSVTDDLASLSTLLDNAKTIFKSHLESNKKG